MTKTELLLGAALALSITAAAAEEDMQSGNYWLPNCRKFLDGKQTELFNQWEQPICAGIVEGIAWMGANVRLWAPDIPKSDGLGRLNLEVFLRIDCIDVPDGATIFQLVRVVVKHIEAHPERMHEDFHNLALEALRTAWPCK
jgi:hypothetical protein